MVPGLTFPMGNSLKKEEKKKHGLKKNALRILHGNEKKSKIIKVVGGLLANFYS
jgi:glyceraldehyde-3-phosphate dehydrogenase/erythrose-4-phosphate dehydrogenase